MRRLVNLLGVVATAASERVAAAVATDTGQRGSAAAALVHLCAYPDESVEQLSGVLGISQPGAVSTVSRLVDQGRLERLPGKDRRTHALRATPDGEAVAGSVLRHRGDVLAELLAPLDDEERVQLERLLGKVVAHLAADRPGARRLCRLCDRQACTSGGCPLEHTVPGDAGRGL